MKKIHVFAPNTVANVGCGYDILGFALENYGDEIILETRTDNQIIIKKTVPYKLPTHPQENVASVSIASMLQKLNLDRGYDITIIKKIAPGSGLGSSASSAAGAVVALNEMLNKPFTPHELVAFAMEGEKSSSGVAHADNVAPAILGGFTIVRSMAPLDVFNIPYPKALRIVIIYPHIQTKTADAKKILKNTIQLADAVSQWGNVASLVSGLFLQDYKRIGISLQDLIIEPMRSALIPYFDEVKSICINEGALGFGISGSGPSTFAITQDEKVAIKISEKCGHFYRAKSIPITHFVSKINSKGARIL